MDFGDARRILRGLELPRDGFEDVLAKLGTIKGSGAGHSPPKTTKPKGRRAA